MKWLDVLKEDRQKQLDEYICEIIDVRVRVATLDRLIEIAEKTANGYNTRERIWCVLCGRPLEIGHRPTCPYSDEY